MMTFLAPACRCLEALAMSLKSPVDSTTMSTPSSFHGSAAGSLMAHTRISRPFTKIASPLATTSAGSAPCTESCFNRWARVLASARSLTPTISISLAPSAVRKNTRPIRPKPLTPTRILMKGSLWEERKPSPLGSRKCGQSIGDSQHAGNCDDPDPRRPRSPQGPRTFGHGRASGHHVVHHDHVTTGDLGPGLEGPLDIGPALPRPQVALRLGVAQPCEPAGPDGHAETGGQAFGQQSRLVEAPLALTWPPQGDGDQGGHIAGQRRPLLADQLRQRTGQRPLAPELERVDRVADH